MDPNWMLVLAITVTLMLAFAFGAGLKQQHDDRHAV